MALETREEFLEEWGKVSADMFGPDATEEKILAAGNELYDAREIAYNVAEEGLNLTAHRYFHGMATTSLTLMMQLPLEGILPFLVGEAMFHEGFLAGMNYERNGEGVGLGDEKGALECIGPRDNLIRTRKEMEKTYMPIAVIAVMELQKIVRGLAASQGDGGEGEDEGPGSPVILPEDEERGYA